MQWSWYSPEGHTKITKEKRADHTTKRSCKGEGDVELKADANENVFEQIKLDGGNQQKDESIGVGVKKQKG